jgi:thymidylate synthase
MSCSLVDKNFKYNLQNTLQNGCWDVGSRARWMDGQTAKSLFTTQIFETYDLSQGHFPITQLRPIPWKNAIKEILWIYKDKSNNLEVLKNKYGIQWWDGWQSADVAGTIGNRYGYTVQKHNLIDKLIEGLKHSPYSRRHIINLWDVGDLESSDGLYPCAYETLWAVRGSYLDCTLIQRSSDFLAAHHINKIQYVALQIMIARECGLIEGKFSHFINNLHIYDRHIPLAKKLLEVENLTHTPQLKIDFKGFYNTTIEDFSLVNYTPEKKIWENVKLEIAI